MIHERKRIIILLLMVAAVSVVFMTIRSAMQYAGSARTGGHTQLGYNYLRDEYIADDEKPKTGTEYLVGIDLYINEGGPLFLGSLCPLQKVEYNDPRFEQIDSWLTERAHGLSLAEGFDISEYGPREVQGARLDESRYGVRSTLVLLQIAENAAEIQLPEDFKAEMVTELSFFGRPIIVRNID